MNYKMIFEISRNTIDWLSRTCVQTNCIKSYIINNLSYINNFNINFVKLEKNKVNNFDIRPTLGHCCVVNGNYYVPNPFFFGLQFGKTSILQGKPCFLYLMYVNDNPCNPWVFVASLVGRARS